MRHGKPVHVQRDKRAFLKLVSIKQVKAPEVYQFSFNEIEKSTAWFELPNRHLSKNRLLYTNGMARVGDLSCGFYDKYVLIGIWY